MNILDNVANQLRYIKRVLGEAPRNDDGHIILDTDDEGDLKESLGRALEATTGKPQN